MITAGSQFLWQVSRMLYLFIYPALRLWVSCHFPISMLTHLSLHSTSNPSPGPLPAFQAKGHWGLRSSSLEWKKKPNQTKITLFLFWKTRKEFTISSESEPQNSDFWLVAISYPIMPCWNKTTLQGQFQQVSPKMPPTQDHWKETLGSFGTVHTRLETCKNFHSLQDIIFLCSA